MPLLKTFITGACAGVFAMASLVAVTSATAADPVQQVEERQALMKRMGEAMKTLNQFVKEGKGGIDQARASAEALQEEARKLSAAFPQGTEVGVGDSRALPAIWEQPARVEEFVQRLQTASAGLVEATKSDQSAVGANVGALGQVCGECHKNFRRPQS